MKLKSFVISILTLVSVSAADASAQVRMCPLFTDNMVMQQKTDAPVWGTATPGADVTVVTSWNKAKYTVTAAEDGKWMVKVRTTKAGGPYTMTVTESGQEPVIISNILMGEVWLCAGQSNMEMPVKGTWGRVLDYEQELKEAEKYPLIRHLTTQRVTSPRPEDDFSVYGDGWQVCSAESIDNFSATAYFFGREIHLKKNVPVGLINSSWGGTVIEAWMSKEALAGVKDLGEQAEMVSCWPSDREVRRERSKGAVEAWNRLADSFDEIYISYDEFASVPWDDSRWDDMKLPGNLERTYPGYDGHVLVRRTIEIPAAWAGKPLAMHSAGIDDKDVTYFNGERIGRTSGWDTPRSYVIPAELVKEGKAVIAMRIMDIGNTGGVIGNDDSFYIQGPDGVKLSLSGQWKSCTQPVHLSMPPKPMDMSDDPNWATLLYNSMINPLVPYAIKGAIWYQGCSNDSRAHQYRDLQKLMIADWRDQWGYGFPFYITQLANFTRLQDRPCESEWAELREAQMMAAKTVPNTGMAVTIDIGDAGDIHPKNKQEVGRRLALQALNKTYGMSVECSGPMYEGYEVDGNVIRIRFSSLGGGLVAKGGRLEGFTIAGADRKFHWAEARIVGDCVEVSCKDVPRPLAVRYAWAHNPVCNLFNKAGLPASPFRTDDWPGITVGNTSRR